MFGMCFLVLALRFYWYCIGRRLGDWKTLAGYCCVGTSPILTSGGAGFTCTDTSYHKLRGLGDSSSDTVFMCCLAACCSMGSMCSTCSLAHRNVPACMPVTKMFHRPEAHGIKHVYEAKRRKSTLFSTLLSSCDKLSRDLAVQFGAIGGGKFN